MISSFLKRLFSKRKWTYVHQIKLDARYDCSDVTYYYNLFESNDNKRKCIIHTTSSTITAVQDGAMRTTVYFETIYPWLAGRNDPAIPVAEKMPEETTAAFLRGTW